MPDTPPNKRPRNDRILYDAFMTGPVVEARGRSSLRDYAPIAHAQPREFFDMSGEVCEISQAIEESVKATKQ